MIKFSLHNTLPGNGDFWQLVLIPTVSIFRSVELHTAATAEWLFWSITIIHEKK